MRLAECEEAEAAETRRKSPDQRNSCDHCSCFEVPCDNVSTGRAVKSRSFDGSQVQNRQAVVDVRLPFPSSTSTFTETPPSVLCDCHGVSVSVRRSNGFRLTGA